MSVLWHLAWRSLRNRRGSVLLAVLTIAVSVLLLLAVDKLRNDARRSFFSTISGVDLVLGPRTGAVQLLLYSVFHVGEASNTLSWTAYQSVAERTDVAWAVPLSLGDAHAGYRVIGTTPAFFAHYQYGERQALRFAQGQAFDHTFDAVIGAEVARALGYAPGSRLVVGHGMAHKSLHQHDALPFSVSGVLTATGTPLDRSVLVPIEAISAIHIGWESGMPRPGHHVDAEALHEHDLQPQRITAALLGLKSATAAFAVQRQLNEAPGEALMAIAPGRTLQELWGIVGVAETALLLISGVVVVAGLLGMLAIMLATLEQRRREMALLRSVGARPWHILVLLLLECLLLAGAGIALGILLLWSLCASLGDWLAATQGITLSHMLITPYALKLLVLVWASALLLGLFPAIAAYRRALSDGLSIRL